ncbi:MAG: PAS domain-containing sensor histidine kinase [Planctomycetota bacterium]
MRLALGTAFLVIGPLAVGFYAISRHHFGQTIQAQHRAAELQSRILAAALRHRMIKQDPGLIAAIFQEIGAQPTVRSAMILDHKGEIRVASIPGMVGSRIPRDSPACAVCHSKAPKDRNRWTKIKKGEEEVLRTVLPIENKAECHRCHSPEERLNGILILDTSLAGLQADLDRDVVWFVAGAALLAALLLAGVRFLVRRLILIRLARLGGTARSIANGNLEERTTVGGDDVITSLAGDFNHMADEVSTLVSEVREQEAQLINVMNSLDDGLVVLDRDSRVLASNRSFCRRLGSDPEKIRGLRCHDSIGTSLPCFSSDIECPAERCMAKGRTQRAVYQTPSVDGEETLVEEVYASPIFSRDGTVVQVVEIWRDISERVKEELHLAEIERLVSLGTLASGLSHEVNTPLATMLTCAESVLGQIDDYGNDRVDRSTVQAIRENARIIREQVLRCRKITAQFLRFSRGIPPSIEPIDLRQIVAAVAGLVGPTAREAGVEVLVDQGGPLPAVKANAEVVQHVLLNLLVNAIQSCESKGGTVTVGFGLGHEVRILVQDDGCGIPPEEREHLFEPFRSRKPAGTGLGLFLSRSFMRRFGGDIRLLGSAVGKGSCFEILFSSTSPPSSS